jgi:hypothetical protein
MRVLSCMVVALCGAALAQDGGVEISEDPPTPPKTIEKTVAAALRRLQPPLPRSRDFRRELELEAFVLYTRALCGDLRKEDREKLTKWHEDRIRGEERFETPNDLAAVVLAVVAANTDLKSKTPAPSDNANRPPRGSRFDKDHWKLMHECIVALDAAQERSRHGGWQGAGSDLETTHLVLLALRDAARAGYPVAPEFFERALRFLPDAAYADKFRKTCPTATEVAMCLVSTWICRERLALLADPKHAAPEWSRKSAEQTSLLDAVFRDKDTPPTIDCLWAMEQLGSLTGQTQLGGGSWYREGTNRILAAKWLEEKADTPEDIYSTCYAILFLKRPTAPLAAGK